MKLLCDRDLIGVQDRYFDLLQSKVEIFGNANKFTIEDIVYFIDEVDIFWRKNLSLIEYCLKRLTSDYDVYLLSAAMYLGINTNEHYSLKAIGDFQCVDDPILKMDVFIRQGLTKLGNEPIVDFFKRSYSDTITALSEYRYDFIFIPSTLLTWESSEFMSKMIKEKTNAICKSMFVDEFENVNSYLDKFDSIDEIESNLFREAKDYMVFTDFKDKSMSLQDRVQRYFDSHCLKDMFSEESISAKMLFMIPISSLLGQSIDTIYKSMMLNMTPFIRQEISFNYFMLMLGINYDDGAKEILFKAIISFVFYKSYRNDFLSGFEYISYKKRLTDFNIIKSIFDDVGDKLPSIKDLGKKLQSKFDEKIIAHLKG